MRSFFCTLLLYPVSEVYASISSTASLFIENDDISPDGFTRSYDFSYISW